MARNLESKRGPRPFFAQGDAADDAYVWYRDSEYAQEGRAYVEGLWERYRTVCGDREIAFLTDARANFRQRVWEMRLACLLMDRGHKLERPPRDAPDIKTRNEDAIIWLEAVVPDVGSIVADSAIPVVHRVSETECGAIDAVQLDHDKMVLRYTAAIAAKLKQYSGFKARGVVEAEHSYVVAINASSIQHADVRPDIVRAVYGRDDALYTVPVLGNTELTPFWWTARKGLLSSEIHQWNNGNHAQIRSRKTPSAG